MHIDIIYIVLSTLACSYSHHQYTTVYIYVCILIYHFKYVHILILRYFKWININFSKIALLFKYIMIIPYY
jgi:hypothetical protein